MNNRIVITLIFLTSISCSYSKDENEQTKRVHDSSIKQDSLIVNLKSNKILDDVLGYRDEFSSQTSLSFGKNIINKYKIVEDFHWQHDLCFPIPDTLQKVDFVLEKEFWYAQTSNEKLNKVLNFEVFFRKNIDPITKPAWSMMKFSDAKNENWYKDFKIRENVIEQYFIKKTNYLDLYVKNNKLDSTSYKVWYPIIKYQKLAYQLFLPNYDKWDKNYLKSLVELKFNYQDDKKLEMMPFYRRGLLSLMALMNYIENGNNWSLRCQERLIRANFTGKHKDFLLLNLLIQCKDKRSEIPYSQEDYMQLSNDFLATCQIAEYKNYIRQIVDLDKIILKNDEVISIKKEKKQFSKLNNNQITYIDFWASWCAPCRAEMPDSKKLKNEYIKKGLKFVYISTDENPVAWENAMKQIGLSEDESYILHIRNESEIVKKFKINTIPRYMIMDKEGKVINQDAPRPSDPKIRQIFDELLKKK